jgi:hypothetical protein
LWLSDADFGAIYRRGTFTGSNSVPIVTLSSPGPGQIFAAGADITLKATANDPDGNIAKVEFYQGSTKLGEASTAPYNFTWSQVAAGTYHLLARAIDGLGASADSTQIAIVVGSLPQLSNAQVVAGHFQFTVRSDPGSVFQVERANDLENWSQVGSLTNDTGTATFQDPSSLTSVSGFYRLRQQ